MSAQPERWRVSTIEGVFEADLETLKQWIVEGCVLPTDKVSKGSLNWIEAGRAPMLRAAFNGEVAAAPLLATVAPDMTFPSSGDLSDQNQAFGSGGSQLRKRDRLSRLPQPPAESDEVYLWNVRENFLC